MSNLLNTRVKLAINTQNLVNNLGNTFTNETVIIKELLQNARRAGATQVIVNYIEQIDGSYTLFAQDDGKGIDNFQNLLTIAESGWDEATCVQEKPYGMGFLSVLYASKSFSVSSKGKQLSASKEQILRFEEVEIVDCDIDKTEVQVFGLTHKLDFKSFSYLCQAFALPIIFNGAEITRHHAEDYLIPADGAESSIHFRAFHAFEFGKVRLGLASTLCQPVLRFYLQGFFIFGNSEANLSPYSNNRLTIVHLDSTQFFARMPDRDTLVNAKQQLAPVHAALDLFRVNWYRAELTRLGEEAFILQHWDNAYNAGGQSKKLLNTLSSISSSCFLICDAPDERFCHDTGTQYRAVPYLHRSVFESMQIIALDSTSYLEQGFALSLMGYQLGWLIFNKAGLDADHWIHQFVIANNEENNQLVQITQKNTIEPTAEMAFCTSWTGGVLHICESYVLNFRSIQVEVVDFPLARLNDQEEITILYPINSNISDALQQTHSYGSDDDDCQDMYFEQDVFDVQMLLNQHLHTDDVAHLFSAVCNKNGVYGYTPLHGKQFFHCIDATRHYVYRHDTLIEASSLYNFLLDTEVQQAILAIAEQKGVKQEITTVVNGLNEINILQQQGKIQSEISLNEQKAKNLAKGISA